MTAPAADLEGDHRPPLPDLAALEVPVPAHIDVERRGNDGWLFTAAPDRPPGPRPPARPGRPGLTPRQVDVLQTIADHGGTNQEVADRLGIAANSVKSHLIRGMRRLEARDRAHAVLLAMRAGYVR